MISRKTYFGTLNELGQPDGYGRLNSSDFAYTGQFLNGLKHGKGVQYWIGDDIWAGRLMNSKYEGDFFNNKIEGNGSITFSDGVRYEGSFVHSHGNIQGRGTFYSKTLVLEGNMRDYQLVDGNVTWHDLTNGQRYEGEIVNRQPHGKGVMFYPNGDRYDGAWLGGKKNGKGKLVRASHLESYEGDFVNGKMHGYGIYDDSTGGQYTGDFKSGEKHGKGRLYWANGDFYIGDFEHDRLKGKGLMNANVSIGIVYEGDVPEGNCTIKYLDGDFYEGECGKFWKKNGYGVLLYANNGNRYVGMFENDMRHGDGTLFYQSGEKYNGSWEKGNVHGKGTYHWPNGDSYQGYWTNGKRDGKGQLYSIRGMVYDGEWRNDQINGNGTYNYENGDRYEGEFLNGKKEGKGVLNLFKSVTYDGEFLNDNAHGYGTIYYSNTSYFTGHLVDWSRHGQGSLLYVDGRNYTGEWQNGKRHGSGTIHFANGNTMKGEYREDVLITKRLILKNGLLFEGDFNTSNGEVIANVFTCEL